ncbi:MAG: DUF4269 domain-containing protein, partial [Pseudomonadales bacterium]|nr:DUF4269 domain-containing protein [Pseudomonadales bacterium]
QRLSGLSDGRFNEAVRTLKRQGFKTEPAIAQLLGLSGDPYVEVAALRNRDDGELCRLLEKVKNV